MAKSKKLEGSDLEKETLLLDVEELEQKTSRERATKIATSRRLAQALSLIHISEPTRPY